MINHSLTAKEESDRAQYGHTPRDALFAEILNNDAVDWDAWLPDSIALPKNVELFAASFDLSSTHGPGSSTFALFLRRLAIDTVTRSCWTV